MARRAKSSVHSLPTEDQLSNKWVKFIRLSIDIQRDTHKLLKLHAVKNDKTINELVGELVEEYVRSL